eukprot:1157842-Pelagomonas_calceolata.AAC.10
MYIQPCTPGLELLLSRLMCCNARIWGGAQGECAGGEHPLGRQTWRAPHSILAHTAFLKGKLGRPG